MNFVTYDEYVDLFSTWQAKLLNIADKISVTGNVHIRTFWRNKLAVEFAQFLHDVNEIELTTSRQMTPSALKESSQKIRMDETPQDEIPIVTNTPYDTMEFIHRPPDFADIRRQLRYQEEEEDPTVNGEEEDYDIDDEEDDFSEVGSVDAMFDDLNKLKDEYKEAIAMYDESNIDDLPMLDDAVDTILNSFSSLKEALRLRLQWTERRAEIFLGGIDRDRSATYVQNTGRGMHTVRTNTEAEMISDNFSFGTMVPVRFFHEEGFVDYDVSGTQI